MAQKAKISTASRLYVVSKIDQVDPQDRPSTLRTISHDIRTFFGEDPTLYPVNLLGAHQVITRLGVQAEEMRVFNQGLHGFLAYAFNMKLLHLLSVLQDTPAKGFGLVTHWIRLCDMQLHNQERTKKHYEKLRNAIDNAEKMKNACCARLVEAVTCIIAKLKEDLKAFAESRDFEEFIYNHASKVDLPRKKLKVQRDSVMRASLEEAWEKILAAKFQPRVEMAKKAIHRKITEVLAELSAEFATIDALLYTTPPDWVDVLEFTVAMLMFASAFAPGLIMITPVFLLGAAVIEAVDYKRFKTNEEAWRTRYAKWWLCLIRKEEYISRCIDKLVPTDQLAPKIKSYYSYILKYNRGLIRKLAEEKRDPEEVRRIYEGYLEDASPLHEKLVELRIFELTKWDIVYADIKWKKELASGVFGQVWKVRYQRKTLAAKRLFTKPGFANNFLQEYENLK